MYCCLLVWDAPSESLSFLNNSVRTIIIIRMRDRGQRELLWLSWFLLSWLHLQSVWSATSCSYKTQVFSTLLHASSNQLNQIHSIKLAVSKSRSSHLWSKLVKIKTEPVCEWEPIIILEYDGWCYEGSCGPEYWGNKYEDCNGMKQSPIDITFSGNTPTTMSEPSPLTFTGYANVRTILTRAVACSWC